MRGACQMGSALAGDDWGTALTGEMFVVQAGFAASPVSGTTRRLRTCFQAGWGRDMEMKLRMKPSGKSCLFWDLVVWK